MVINWLKKTLGKPETDARATEAVSPTIPVPEATHDPYVSDAPIQGRSEDRFNRSPFALRIAETIATRLDPSSIVLGIFGPWGDGKTSVLEMMRETLEEHSRVITLKFNPWHFQSEDLLLRGFFATLAQAMDRSLPNKKERAGELLQKYGALLSLGSLTLGGVVQINPGDAAKGMGEALSNVSLDDLRTRIEAMLDASGKRVVVLIDDIDRLDRHETHAIFKLVKLSASFRHISYVLAFDDNVVSSALGERYGAGGSESGRAFLDKIIQVPLHLPPADEVSLRLLAMEGVQAALNQSGIELTQGQVDAFVRHFDDGLLPRLDTPRRAKLYANALMFALPILKGEVNPVDQMLLEGVRIFYPQLYAGIRDNSAIFLDGSREGRGAVAHGSSKPIDVLLERCMPGSGDDEREVVKTRLLLPLFPRVGNTMYGSDWESTWSKDQKAASKEYFKRYFTYGVPIGDVSDAQIARFSEEVVSASAEGRRDLLQIFATKQAIPRLILRLRQRVDSFNETQAYALISTVSQNPDLLPRERGMFVPADTFARSAMLVGKLLGRIPAGQPRQLEAVQLIKTAASLSFAMECNRWLRHDDREDQSLRVLPAEDETLLFELLAERIEAESGVVPLYLSYAKDAPSLYWAWVKSTSKSHVQMRMEPRFQISSKEMDDFLDCFVGESWGMETGIPRPSDFRRDQYNSVSGIIEPQFIAANLRSRYGPQLDDPIRYPDDGMPKGLRVAHQFMGVHQQAIAAVIAQKSPAKEDDIEIGKEQ